MDSLESPFFSTKDDDDQFPDTSGRAWMRCDLPPLSETDLDAYCRGYATQDIDHWGYWIS